jgi:hypothetical protein
MSLEVGNGTKGLKRIFTDAKERAELEESLARECVGGKVDWLPSYDSDVDKIREFLGCHPLPPKTSRNF